MTSALGLSSQDFESSIVLMGGYLPTPAHVVFGPDNSASIDLTGTLNQRLMVLGRPEPDVIEFHMDHLIADQWRVGESDENLLKAVRRTPDTECEEVLRLDLTREGGLLWLDYTLNRSPTCPTFQPLTGQE
jgi:hypothetical protein